MEEKIFKLKGRTLVIVDWANVYGWFKRLKWEIDPKKLYDYLRSYPEIYEIRLYFGIEKDNPKSLILHKNFRKIGYKVISKEVKWIPIDLKASSFKDRSGRIQHLFKNEEGKSVFEKFQKINQIMKDLRLYRRKCDFDCEITLDVMKNLNEFEGLLLFSGDGDYAILINELVKRKKQAIVVFAPGCKGKEFEDFKKGLYLCSVKKLRKFIQK